MNKNILPVWYLQQHEMLDWEILSANYSNVLFLIVHFVVWLTVLEPAVANKYYVDTNTIYNALKSGVSW